MCVTSVIRKGLKIHEGEGRKVFQFAFLAALVQCGLAIGVSVADSLFLTQVGAGKLPVIYLIMPVLMLVYIPISAYLMNRFGIERLFDATLFFLVFGALLCFCTISPAIPFFKFGGKSQIIYYIIKLYVGFWYIALYTLIWNFIDCYFDILDAKRLFPILSGGMAFGSIAGGGIVTSLATLIPLEQFFLIWATMALIAFPVVIFLRRAWEKIEEEEMITDYQKISLKQQTLTIVKVLGTSRYSNFMILAFLSTLIVTTLCEFQCMKVFEQERSASQIAALFGKLYVVVNCLTVIINFFVFNRLVAFWGVRDVMLIQPIVYAVTFSYFFLDYGFGAAVAGFFAYQGILTAVEYNNQNFLFNALPSEKKAELRTFIEGLCEPVATASAGLFLIIYAAGLSPQAISFIGLVSAGIALCSVLGLRSCYLGAMIANLKKTWLDFSRLSDEKIARLNDNEIQTLKQIADSNKRDETLTAIQMLWMNDKILALELLLRFIDKSQLEDQRFAAPLLSTMLDTDDSEIFRQIIMWRSKTKKQIDAVILEEFGKHNLLSHENIHFLSKDVAINRKAAAAVALWKSWKPNDNLEAMRITNKLMAGSEIERLTAIRIIGKFQQPRHAHFLAYFLKDSSQDIKQQALTSISQLVNEESDSLQDIVLKTIRQRNHSMRITGFNILKKIKSSECIKPLLMLSPYFTLAELRYVETVILEIGLQSVPILTAILQDSTYPYNCKSIAARTLSNLAFPQMEALAPVLIHKQIEQAYNFLCAHWVLSKESKKNTSIKFMAYYYRDIQSSTIDFVLELLTISGQLPEFELITAGLRSRNLKEHGNAIETIEQGCPYKIFKLLLPLVDSRPLKEKIDFYLKTFQIEAPSLKNIILTAIKSSMQIESAGAIQIAWQFSKGNNALFERNSIHKILQAKLIQTPMDIVEEVIFSLLSKEHSSSKSNSAPNTIEKAYWLSQARLFKSFKITEIELMARKAVQLIYKKDEYIYRRSEICDTIYIVISGKVQIRRPKHNSVTLKKLKTFGTEALKGNLVHNADAISKDSVLLAIPKEAILESAQIYPHIAIQLFAHKLGII